MNSSLWSQTSIHAHLNLEASIPFSPQLIKASTDCSTEFHWISSLLHLNNHACSASTKLKRKVNWFQKWIC